MSRATNRPIVCSWHPRYWRLLTVPESASVPRRRMGLQEILTHRLCPAEGLPVVAIADIMPVRSMFDYDGETAVAVSDLD
ncbi:MAG: hypothetical protein M5U19_20125 [Microthrixaceae bacterium]|nr:hypothetical protein [Microthrixaceae bacterium]